MRWFRVTLMLLILLMPGLSAAGVVAQGFPAIDIQKFTNGQNADEAPGPTIPVGSPVTWTYEVTNTGSVELSGIVVNDDQGVIVICPGTTLAPGASMICTGDGTAVEGQYENIGTVSASPTDGSDPIADIDFSHYFGSSDAIDIEKFTNGEDADAAPGPSIPVGSPVNWTYVVTNNDDGTLTEIEVIDDQGVTVTCPSTTLTTGTSMTCTASGSAIAGQYANIGTVFAIEAGEVGVSDADASHYFGLGSGIDIEKSTNGLDADSAPGPFIPVGSPVTWTYEVTNTSGEALNSVTVTDNQTIDVLCPQSTLVVGESMTCSASGAATPGQYSNTGSVTASLPGGGQVSDFDLSHYFGSEGGLDIEKSTNFFTPDAPPGPELLVGTTVTWRYTVTNTDINFEVTDIVVTDDQQGTITCPQTSLAAGNTMLCTSVSGTVQPGQYTNIATATGLLMSETPVGDTDASYYFGFTPAIDIEKSTNGEDADSAPGPYVLVGGTVNWIYVVTNIGTIDLLFITVSDSDAGLTITCPDIDELAPGESFTCTASSTAQAGQYENEGHVEAFHESSEQAIEDSDLSHYFGATLAVEIEKSTNGQDADSAPGPELPVGATVNWTYVVTNTGNAPFSSVVVTDDQGVVVSCPQTMLAAGANMTCTASGTVTAGQYENTGTVTASVTGIAGTFTDSDLSHYFGVVASEPSIDIEKATNGNQNDDSAPGPTLTVGSTVTWTYVVTNTGDVPLTNIEVTDDQGVTVTCTQDSLSVSAVMDCTASGTVTEGQYQNTGTVTATPVDSEVPVMDSDASHYFGTSGGVPFLSASKTVSDVNGGVLVPGDVLEYTITISNTGDADATGVPFIDTIPANTTYVAESVTVDGFLHTDADDGDGVYADGTVVDVDTFLIPAGDSMVITFRVQVVNPYPDDASLTIRNQGFIGTTPTDDPTPPGTDDPTDIIVVDGPGIAKAFRANQLLDDEETGLRFTLFNPEGSPALTNLSFADTLPDGLEYTEEVVSNECGGTVTFTGDDDLSFSGGTLPAGPSQCRIEVRVRSTGEVHGTVTNVSSLLTSDEGLSSREPAVDTVLLVEEPEVPEEDDDDEPSFTPQGPDAETFLCDNLGIRSNYSMDSDGTIDNILVNGIHGNTYCRIIAVDAIYRTNPGEVGVLSLVQQGVVHAVDMFGLLPDGTPVREFHTPAHICVSGTGTVYFISALDNVVTQPVTGQVGRYRCVTTWTAGMVVLVGGSPQPGNAPLPNAPSSPAGPSSISGCTVTTTNMVRLRSTPDTSIDTNIVTSVPFAQSLAADQYQAATPGWYHVTFGADQGWIREDFLDTGAGCPS